MRILIPTVDYPPIEGGIATVALELSRELAAMGHEVTVIAPAFPGMDAFDAAEPARVIRFPGYHLGWLRFFPLWRTAWPLTRQTDLILAINVAYGGVIARLARLRRGAPYLAFAYAYEFLKFKRAPLIRALLRSVYGHAAATAAISRYTRRNLELFGVSQDDIVLIRPGARLPVPVSTEAVRAVRQRFDIGEGRMILSVGRLIPRKGHITLVRAMPQILDRHPNTHCVMAGRGPCMEECAEKARALGIEGQAHFPGYVDDATLAALYAACDVFALPAGEDERGQVEGFGLVFSEAHAHGKPVVAGRSGGVPDAVLDGETGFLVEPQNPEALADRIIAILDDPALAARLGNAGRRRIEEELNWRVFAEKALEAVQRKGGATAP